CSCSNTSRTARSRTSLGYLRDVDMAPPSQTLEPPAFPGRFKDVVQDAFLRVSGRLAHLRDPAAFGAYLHRTVVRLCALHFRRRRREKEFLRRNLPIADHINDPEFAELEDLRRALLGLPARQRAAIVLRYYEQIPEVEIASILGCRVGTVGSLISRGLKALRETRWEVDDA
ncbi:MAG: sigma-70 family RNA polymerase sigma factor, partial [Actinomycetota bacterium]|nr:sigma-70 family RNA polymerase sigma factor [Actinomycetota bacterium]